MSASANRENGHSGAHSRLMNCDVGRNWGRQHHIPIRSGHQHGGRCVVQTVPRRLSSRPPSDFSRLLHLAFALQYSASPL